MEIIKDCSLRLVRLFLVFYKDIRYAKDNILVIPKSKYKDDVNPTFYFQYISASKNYNSQKSTNWYWIKGTIYSSTQDSRNKSTFFVTYTYEILNKKEPVFGRGVCSSPNCGMYITNAKFENSYLGLNWRRKTRKKYAYYKADNIESI
ncbi:hypothetical protein PHYBLDRAFT_168639 [Phycomyces blakesleeanus NRRL 1555(-)]|uniref:Uncharacterized protein n=1 Tax=Phycomyces blakesleeanus (strain ATCC 8743b / DSM 1359 / FGSC 10004 / NBRC 33097 / NRRL 1555) TaxID=763407 RepID=A0A162U8R5_PHYB8|nr:hypothetical protein PHYBLDRAFT_168639 [Phycomyces blakesleeanus NRRL 1555(-)]OAD73283.1 hypothetical protein PHYBLDRAFT_168639 [Phycomyces blakesleeanus NRRL 1555(-)]|eukprot:XP_018291323.1 hypothetical protein PHYBLDRAFT_168639 [Phycomyces blakesleeanus NRRL 1555(-)]